MSRALTAYTEESRAIRLTLPIVSDEIADETGVHTVLVVDDRLAVGDGIELAIRKAELAGQILHAADAEAALGLVRKGLVDLVLFAGFVGDYGELTLLRRLRQQDADLPVIVLSASYVASSIRAAVETGATGNVVGAALRGVLTQAVDLALRGERLAHLPLHCVAEAIGPADVAVALPTPSSDGGNRHGRLTKQESRVLGHITEGMSNKEIARQLGIFEGTVKVHVKSILRKLNAKNRTVAALMAVGAMYATS